MGTSDRTYRSDDLRVPEKPVPGVWQDISTAPKTGQCVIFGYAAGAMFQGEVDVGFWHDGSLNYWKQAGWYEEMDRASLLTARAVNPTHWQPLPRPPSVS